MYPIPKTPLHAKESSQETSPPPVAFPSVDIPIPFLKNDITLVYHFMYVFQSLPSKEVRISQRAAPLKILGEGLHLKEA